MMTLSPHRFLSLLPVLGFVCLTLTFGLALLAFHYLPPSGQTPKTPQILVGNPSPVRLFFQPSTSVLPPNASVKLMFDAKTNLVSAVNVKVNFEPTKVKLAAEVAPANKLATVIRQTTAAEANASGRVTLVLGLSPGATPPTGIFELATLTFQVISGQSNQTTSLSISTNGIELVTTTGEVLSFETAPAQLILNPPASPSPSPSPSRSPSPSPSRSPSPSPSPSRSPSPSPSPSSLPVCKYDYDHSHVIDRGDIEHLLANWQGSTNLTVLMAIVQNWGAVCN